MRGGFEGAGGGDGKLFEFEVLLAVEEHAHVEVRDDVFHGVGRFGEVSRYYAESREDLEIVGAFVDEGEVVAFGAEAEVVEDGVPVRVGVCVGCTGEGFGFFDLREVFAIGVGFFRQACLLDVRSVWVILLARYQLTSFGFFITLPMVYLLPSAGVSGLSAWPSSKLQISVKAYGSISRWIIASST